MPEPIPCSICGGGHPPDACPGAKEETKSDRVLTPEEKKEREQLQGQLEKNLSRSGRIPRGWLSTAAEIIFFAEQKGFTLNVAHACQIGLEEQLSRDNISHGQKIIYLIISLTESKGITLDFSKPEISFACEKRVKTFFSPIYSVFEAEEFISFVIKNGIALDTVGACQEGLEMYLRDHRIDDAEQLILFAKQKNISLDIAAACQKKIENCLTEVGTDIESVEQVISFAEQNGVTIDLASACQKVIKADLDGDLDGRIDYLKRIISFAKKNDIALDFVTACQKGLAESFYHGQLDVAEEFVSFADENDITIDIAPTCEEGLEIWLSRGQFDIVEDVISFAEQNGIILDIAVTAQRRLEVWLSKGQIGIALIFISFAEQKNIVLDLFKPEIASACQKGLETSLLNKNVEAAEEINSRFLHLSPEKAFALYSHHLQELFSVLEKNAPQLVSQCQKSLELFFSFFAFRENQEQLLAVLEANPFLSKALEANLRFGPKLTLKYPEFDETSRSKIQFLYEAKADILKANPVIDPSSLEFRKLMQERLHAFGRNEEILKAIKKEGVDADAFLDYDETQYFTLKSSEETSSFAERLQTPISRLDKTLDSYVHLVKNVLSAYREDLAKINVLPKSAEDLQKQIADLEAKVDLEKAKPEAEKKEGKILGMEKGMDGLKQKMAKIQTISCWESITSEIERFRILKETLIKSQQALISAETQYQEALSAKMPSGVEISKLKAKIGQAKEEFTRSLAILERRVNEFRENLTPTLSILNSQEVPNRADAIVQEINEKTAEQFSHFDSDRTTLAGMFSEKTDKRQRELEDSPMSIFVFARNPDTDLYQGNYSPCCICIESEHMGAECTIADYNTDLGVQIINIWDETKNEPVTAAWCWLGIDQQGRTALVVDNIESNTRFSSVFPDKLSQELFAYLKNYAKAIGAKRVVLGKANNDLPTAGELVKLPEAEAIYSKLGGQNLRLDGYFLEAEDKNVKLLWERGEEKKRKKEKTKIERKIIKLTDVESNGLTENDYAAILDLEREIYEETGLTRGQAMIEDLEKGNGLDYSAILRGKRPEKIESELLGYLVAYEDQTDDGDPCVYLDDIALAPDCQGQDLGWKLLENALLNMKEKAKKDKRSVLFDMHLKPGSQRLFEKHKEDMEKMDVKLVESALVMDYYDDGEDALYCVYEVKE